MLGVYGGFGEACGALLGGIIISAFDTRYLTCSNRFPSLEGSSFPISVTLTRSTQTLNSFYLFLFYLSPSSSYSRAI